MTEKSNIWIFHLSRYGYADYAAGLIDHLPLDNCLIFLSKYHSVEVQKPFLTVRTYRNGLEFLWSSFIHLPAFLWQLLRLVKKREVKVAYFPGFHYWDLPVILLCKANHISIVYTVHDGILHEGEENWTHRILQNTCIRLSDELVFLTDYMKRETLRSLRLDKPSVVIPHGPVEIPGSFVTRSHSPKLKLLFLGRIGKYKGLEMLLEAVQRCNDDCWECLTVAGKPLYPLKMPKHPKIRLIAKWLSVEEIAELLRSHHVLVLPYSSATQSGVVTLGISAGIPMICTSVGGLPEQLAENEALWTNPTVNDLVNSIHRLSRQPEIYADLQQRLTLKKEDFDWQKPAAQLGELLSKICFTPST